MFTDLLKRSVFRLRLVFFLPLAAALTLLCSLFFFLPGRTSQAAGAEFYVDASAGADGPACGTTGAPCQTISYTLNSRAANLDSILIAQGYYPENLVIGGLDITLRGGYSNLGGTWLANAGETVIDGRGLNRTLLIHNSTSLIERVTITGGQTPVPDTDCWGAGVWVTNADVTIRSSIIHGNRADCSGAGVEVNSDWGPAHLSIQDSIIRGNDSGDHGGGLTVWHSSADLSNVLLIHNSAAAGSVVTFEGGDLLVQNSTIAHNVAGAGINALASGDPSDALTVRNAIIWGHPAYSIYCDMPSCAVTYSDIQGGWAGDGNIDSDPMFVNPSTSQYSLQPWSPAVDAGASAGAPDHDLDYNPRPHAQTGLYDMGAYEYQGAPLNSSGYWSLSGNSGTDPETTYLGTTDGVTLTLAVSGTPALRLRPALSSPNLIGGHPDNWVTGGVWGATIGGGGSDWFWNRDNRVTDAYGVVGGGTDNQAGDDDAVLDDAKNATVGGGNHNLASHLFTTVGGGTANTASGQAATVSGGWGNTASGDSAAVGGGTGNAASYSWATISGGSSNTASGYESTVSGGGGNEASGWGATVGGGNGNVASGSVATVPGGSNNDAAADYTFAAGYRAQALHQGAFVWADSANAEVASTAANQFTIRASGGISLSTAGAPFQLDGSQIWHAGNDGSASGLDADLLDGNNSSYYQRRVSQSCPAGSSIRAVNADGTVVCETDDSAGATAGTGLDLAGGELSINPTYRLPQSCANGQIAEWDGAAWQCGNDDAGSISALAKGGSAYSRGFLVGTLPYGDCNAFQKLLVNVWGGGWSSASMGEETYMISARNGDCAIEPSDLKITRTRLYGATSMHELQIYDEGYGYDVVVAVAGDFPAVAIRSQMLTSGGYVDQPIVPDYDLSSAYRLAIQVQDIIAANGQGFVGIGTDTPETRLDIAGGSILLDAGAGIYGHQRSGDRGFIELYDGSTGDMSLAAASTSGDIVLMAGGENERMRVSHGGNIGIGSAFGDDLIPARDLHIRSDLPYVRYEDTGAPSANQWETGVRGEGFDYRISEVIGGTPQARLVVEEGGAVGIGNFSPSHRLTVENDESNRVLQLIGPSTNGVGATLTFGDYSTTNDVFLEEYMHGALEIHAAELLFTPAVALFYSDVEVSGKISADILQIRGGDLAEPFAVSGRPEPGMVVSIDPDAPGQLKLSAEAYDHKVAGCVSGAGDLDPGVIMYDQALEGENAFPVALSGRVYCWADASYGPIQPGDMLTTSATPGHVMAVQDHDLAQGAIVGKAMSSLADGQGLVLVLVALQ